MFYLRLYLFFSVKLNCYSPFRVISPLMPVDPILDYCNIHQPQFIKAFLCFYFPQMASATATYGQKESSDQNFDYMFKILIIGNSSVGKTSFLFRYADDSFTPAFVSTVGIDFKVKTIYRNDKRIKLQIWVSPRKKDAQFNHKKNSVTNYLF